jgi:hypothetical protein
MNVFSADRVMESQMNNKLQILTEKQVSMSVIQADSYGTFAGVKMSL